MDEKTSLYAARNTDNIPLFNSKHKLYKNSFFLPTITEWGNLDSNLQNSGNFIIFKNNIVKFNRPKPNSFFNCSNLKMIRLITRPCQGLRHLCEHKFKYSLQICINPLCSCSSSNESTSHFLVHCPVFDDKRHTLVSTLNNNDWKMLQSN